MITNLAVGVATMAACLLLQLALLTRALMYYAHHQASLEKASFMGTLAILNAVMCLLMFGNLGQIALWGLLYELLGEFDNYRTAFYHSAVNFATLGYGDIVMSEERRLLGPIQALNGVLMVGISTAAFMTTLRDAIQNMMQNWAPRQAKTLQDIAKRRAD